MKQLLTPQARGSFAATLTLGLTLLGVAGCSGGAGGNNSSSGGTAGSMDIVQASNGFGQFLPHRTTRLDSNGQPTSELIEIRTVDTLLENVTATNPVLPTPLYPVQAQLPNGLAGNHFMFVRFTQPIGVDSVLDGTPGSQAVSGLVGSISIVTVDPQSGATTPVEGRAFIGGQTFAGIPTGSPPELPFQPWVGVDDNGDLVALDVDGAFPGLGFPGTTGAFAGSELLARDDTFVFVVDSDDNLSTFETFPAGRQILMRVRESVESSSGEALLRPGVASSIVGTDNIAPEVQLSPPPTLDASISPGNGDTDVDPLSSIRIGFTEAVQPSTLGDLLDGTVPGLSDAVLIEFGPSTARTRMPYAILPSSVFDLTTYDLVPVFNFPGEGPQDQQCGVFNLVDVSVTSGLIGDLNGNLNIQGPTTSFTTGEGPALANVPVIPDAIYVGRLGATPGLSLLDLNGFGQGTGNPNFDPTLADIQPEDTNFPNNPNVVFQGSMLRPALTLGTCTFNGGSAGVFTLSRDSSLNDLLVRAPLITSVRDMMLGHALDIALNNGPAPFGCQSGGQNVGGNICAFTGRKQVQTVADGSTLSPAAQNQTAVATTVQGAENLITWAPHPNPPPLIFPPPCVSPFINGQEPTSVDTPVPNRLVPGNPFGDPLSGIPPDGILAEQQNNFFQGPSLPASNPSACQAYGLRQQVGHFLYVTDRARREVVVFNSNRMTVIDRIEVADPTFLAVGPNLDFLAVSNQQANTVSFINIDPTSSNFHEVQQITAVGSRPTGLAWEPGNEDILVVNEGSNTMSVISAFSLAVRKTVNAGLSEPFDVVITPRQANFGLQRNVYFAYVLNRSGRVTQFESGPNTVNGWGFDDFIGTLPFEFINPKAIQPDHLDLRSGFWVAHEGPIDQQTGDPGVVGEGALSNVVVTSGTFGQLPFGLLGLLIPQFRDINHSVNAAFGEEVLSGVPVDIAFDNLLNVGGSLNYATSFSAGAPIPINGKSIVRNGGPANNLRSIFLAIPNPAGADGLIDVIVAGNGQRRDTDPFQAGVQSIPAPDVNFLMDFFRQ